MSKNLYKVIFNEKRGCMMAVAETTKRTGKSVADAQDPHCSLMLIPSSFTQSYSLLAFSLDLYDARHGKHRFCSEHCG